MRKQRFFHGWVIVAIGALSLGLSGGIWYSFSVFFVPLIEEFGGSRAETALAFSTYVLAQGVGNAIVGALVGRYGVRRVMPLGAIFLAASLAACATVSSLWQYYVIFGLIVPIGCAATGPVVCYALVNQWFAKRRGLGLGAVSAGIGVIGIFALVPLSQYLVTTVGWRNGYLWLAAIVLALLPATAYVFVRDRPQDMGLLPDGAVRKADWPPEVRSPIKATTKTIDRRTRHGPAAALRTRQFWLLCLVGFSTLFATQAVFVHQVAYFLDLGRSQVFAAFIAALVGLASTPGKIGSGWLSDRFGRRAVYTGGVSCTALALVTLILMPSLSGDWSLYAFAILFAAGYATQATLNPAIASDIFLGPQFPPIYGLMTIAASLGAATGAWFAGYLFDINHSYTTAFLAAIVAVALACTVIWLVSPRQIRASSQAGLVAGQTGQRRS